MTGRWTPSSWRDYTIKQTPQYQDQVLLQKIEHELKQKPPLVFSGECDRLTQELANCVDGKAFLLQGGDCAESFSEFNTNIIRDTYKVLLQMALVLTFASLKPIVKIGRLAGQFAKPRSQEFEQQQGTKLPSYRGDIINSSDFLADHRQPNPLRMLDAYHQSAATLNLLRAFSDGGLADLHRIHQWTLDFVSKTDAILRLHKMTNKIDECLSFMEACGLTSDIAQIKTTHLYTSHESLLLNYEQAMTRQDSISGLWYNCSAHFLWIGNRTRFLDSAHVEFLRGIKNPIGIKCDHQTDLDELTKIIKLLNPDNQKGRISLISRMGHERILELPKLIRHITQEGLNVIWVCDPMHGNIERVNEIKTRRIDNILSEVKNFFDIHQSESTHAGGIHLEMTGKNVTECLGGKHDEIKVDDLTDRYHTHCDPRLNGAQSLELAFTIADLLRTSKQAISS